MLLKRFYKQKNAKFGSNQDRKKVTYTTATIELLTFWDFFPGDNFLGIVYRATCSTEDESNAINLFVKMAPEDETKRALMSIHNCFMRETYVYKVVITEM